MDKTIKCLLVNVSTVLISEIVEMQSQIGDPDCKLINPYSFSENEEMKPWMPSTDQKEFMIRSSDILTMADPKKEIIEKYLELTS